MSNAQAKLDALRQWPAKKLQARVPAWAKPAATHIKPFAPDLRQFIPRGPTTIVSNAQHRAWVFESQFKSRPDDAAQYVQEWDKANNLAPHPVEWIRPSLGCFG
jgi:hypothetical protein